MIKSTLNPYELKGLEYFYETAEYAETLGIRWKNKRLKVPSFWGRPLIKNFKGE
jgi:hypothetical protein